MFRIKICGVTRRQDAELAAEAGADAIGLNFYARSRRSLDLAAARVIVDHLPSGVAKVGVFVNATAAGIETASEVLGLDYVQLHGDERPEVLAELPSRAVIRAFSLGPSGWPPIVEYLTACQRLACLPAAVLIDAFLPGAYGGTGQTVNWRAVQERPIELANLPLILAGGLTAENVAQAISEAGPWGVDTASGVEQAPGIKDAEMVRRFIASARAAFSAVATSGSRLDARP